MVQSTSAWIYRGEIVELAVAQVLAVSYHTFHLDHARLMPAKLRFLDKISMNPDARSLVERRFGVLFQQGAFFLTVLECSGTLY